jgi:hypothetical protein
MSVFGRPLNEVSKDHLQELLNEAELETLLWEAKGGTIHKDSVRKAVCAFANGDETGYLILGVEEAESGWVLSGCELSDDPVTWIGNVVKAGVSPVPRIDVRVLEGQSADRSIAIIQVEPVATPPCFTGGTVFERIPGSSVRVKNPTRLADLYRRGQTAVAESRLGANDLCRELRESCERTPGCAADRLSLVLAVSSTGKPQDISARLFSRSFEQSMTNAVRDHLAPSEPMPDQLRPAIQPRMTQSSAIVQMVDRSYMGYERAWQVQARWDGAIGVYYSTEFDGIQVSDLVENALSQAVVVASELLEGLGASGDIYLTLDLDGGDRRISLAPPEFSATVRRGPLPAGFGADVLASIGRELARALGQSAYEMPVEGGPDEDREDEESPEA